MKHKLPIHQWTNVDDYLQKAHVSPHLKEPFHEVVFARGKYPWNISPADAKKFARKAQRITLDYEIIPEEGKPFLMMFEQLISQWIDYKISLQ